VTYVILFILAVVWAVYLANWLRTRTESSRSNSISSFSKHMNTLQRATPRTGLAIAPRSRTFPGSTSFAPVRRSLPVAAQRRRTVLLSLLGATAITLLGAMAVGGMFTTLFLLALVATGGYVYLLASAQKRTVERRTKVRHLPTPAAPPRQRIDFFAEDRSGEVGAETVRHIRAVGSN
jgi:Flp pilus assembly protein TadB